MIFAACGRYDEPCASPFPCDELQLRFPHAAAIGVTASLTVIRPFPFASGCATMTQWERVSASNRQTNTLSTSRDGVEIPDPQRVGIRPATDSSSKSVASSNTLTASSSSTKTPTATLTPPNSTSDTTPFSRSLTTTGSSTVTLLVSKRQTLRRRLLSSLTSEITEIASQLYTGTVTSVPPMKRSQLRPLALSSPPSVSRTQ